MHFYYYSEDDLLNHKYKKHFVEMAETHYSFAYSYSCYYHCLTEYYSPYYYFETY